MSRTDASQKLDRDRIHWQIWSNDYFDYEASPLLECEGAGLVAGCRELWLKTLEEGILDDGRPTFTGFMLCLAEHGRLMLPRDPLMNHELARLRQWRQHPDVIELLSVALSYKYETPDELLSVVQKALNAAELCELVRQSLPVTPAAIDTPQTAVYVARAALQPLRFYVMTHLVSNSSSAPTVARSNAGAHFADRAGLFIMWSLKTLAHGTYATTAGVYGIVTGNS